MVEVKGLEYSIEDKKILKDIFLTVKEKNL